MQDPEIDVVPTSDEHPEGQGSNDARGEREGG
jgi:hypothetical protein